MILEFRILSKERLDNFHMPMVMLFTTPTRDIRILSIPILGEVSKSPFAPLSVHQAIMQRLVVGRNARIDTHEQQRRVAKCANRGGEFKIRRIFGWAFKSKRRATITGINFAEKSLVRIDQRHEAE